MVLVQEKPSEMCDDVWVRGRMLLMLCDQQLKALDDGSQCYRPVVQVGRASSKQEKCGSFKELGDNS